MCIVNNLQNNLIGDGKLIHRSIRIGSERMGNGRSVGCSVIAKNPGVTYDTAIRIKGGRCVKNKLFPKVSLNRCHNNATRGQGICNMIWC